MEQKITALTVQKRNPNRINVFLDDNFAFGLSRITASWLKIGQVIGPEKINELKESDSIEVAYQKALRFISFKPRTAQQVIQRLKKHGFDEELIETVIDRLNEMDYLNDAQFAENWVENRSTYQPRSAWLIQAELRKKGIAQEIISEAVASIDDSRNALRAAEKQARRYSRLNAAEFRKKMTAYLSRRGFNYGTISEIFPEVLKEHQNIILEQD